jgi:hypothetical protein
MKRRDVIGRSILAAAGAALPLPAISAQLVKRAPTANNWFVRANFEARLKELFTVAGPSGSQYLRLVAVEDATNAAANGLAGSQECFVAVFRGTLAKPLTQRTYRLTNPSTGPLNLFLVPGHLGRKTMYYTATFNRVTA